MNNNENGKVKQAMLNKKQNNRTRCTIAVLAVLALLAGIGYVCREYVVNGWQTTDVTVSSAAVSEDSIELSGEVNGLLAGVRSYTYTVDEDTVTVFLDCTLPVGGRDSAFDIKIEGDFSDVIEVDISDGRNSLVVWLDE